MEMFHSRVQKCAKLPADAKCGEGCEEVRFEQDKMGQAGDNSGFCSAKYLCLLHNTGTGAFLAPLKHLSNLRLYPCILAH